jgi:hypothetical protein
MIFNGKNRLELDKIVSQINSFLAPENGVDYFEVLKFSSKGLTICASSDFSYYHNIEITFESVFTFRGDFEWKRNEKLDSLSITEEYIDSINSNQKGDTSRLCFVFNTDDPYYSYTNNEILVWAKGISFCKDTVLYWKKENLAPGEKVADWVK